MRHDGVVEFGGRVDFQVKIRGHRIELGEIEALLDTHPSVDRAVVVARGDAAEARLVAFVVLTPGSSLDDPVLRTFVAQSLPDVMVPDVVVALDSFPLTPNGKVDRGALPKDVGPGAQITAQPSAPPEDEMEQLVADVWQQQLQRPVGRHDNFFEIGGHSLLAVAVFRQLQERSGVRLALTDVFRYPTVAGFAAYLSRQSGGTAEAATPAADKAGTDRGALRRQALQRRRSE
jgi:hypothetical protein